jgi:Cyclic nucleotide-binding domain
MTHKSGLRRKFSRKPPFSDGDGNHIHNTILIELPPKECQMLASRLEFVRLKTHHVLHEPGDSLKSAYFCNTGLISILSVFPDGKSVEVGLIGKEGFVGLPLVVGFRTATTRAVAQIDATAFRVDGLREDWAFSESRNGFMRWVDHSTSIRVQDLGLSCSSAFPIRNHGLCESGKAKAIGSHNRGLSLGSLSAARTTSALMMTRRWQGHFPAL